MRAPADRFAHDPDGIDSRGVDFRPVRFVITAINASPRQVYHGIGAVQTFRPRPELATVPKDFARQSALRAGLPRQHHDLAPARYQNLGQTLSEEPASAREHDSSRLHGIL